MPSSGRQAVLNVPLLVVGVVLIVEIAGAPFAWFPAGLVHIIART